MLAKPECTGENWSDVGMLNVLSLKTLFVFDIEDGEYNVEYELDILCCFTSADACGDAVAHFHLVVIEIVLPCTVRDATLDLIQIS